MKNIVTLLLFATSLPILGQEVVTKSKIGGVVRSITVGIDSIQNRINVLDFGIKNDSSAQESGAMALLQEKLDTNGSRLYFPPGKYRFERQSSSGTATVFTISGRNVDIEFAKDAFVYFRTTASQDSSTNLFLINSTNGASGFSLKGGTFVGNVNESAEESTAVVYAIQKAENITISDAFFESATPFSAASSETNNGLLLQNCIINNQGGSTVPIRDSKIINCTWTNDSINPDRSHSIYAYGMFDRLQIIGCTFKNNGPGSYGLKYRADAARYQTKTNVIVSNCLFENNEQFGVEFASPEDVYAVGISVSNNVFLNSMGVKMYACSGCVVEGNIFVADAFGKNTFYYYPIQIGGNGGNTKNASALTQGVVVANNVIKNTAKWVTELKLNSNPSDGDSLIIDSLVYIFKNSPGGVRDIQIGGSNTATTNNLAVRLHTTKNDGGLVGVYSETFEDVVQWAAEQRVLINTVDSVDVRVTGSAISILREGQNYTDNLGETNIDVGQTYGPVTITNNILENAGNIKLIQCLRPIVSGNTIAGNYSLKAMDLAFNVFPIVKDNLYYPKFGSSAFRADCQDYLPYIANNIGFTNWEFLRNYDDIGYGNFANTSLGDGKARCILYPGIKLDTNMVYQNNVFYWSEGDSVNFYRNDTLIYAFTMTYGTPGSNQFTDGDDLVTLIDATSEFVATNVRVSTANDPIPIYVASAGTAGNNYKIRTVTQSKFNGLVTNNGQFVGGSANPDITVMFCPFADGTKVPSIMARNSAAASLSSSWYVDSVVNGSHYIISHNNASGSELVTINLY